MPKQPVLPFRKDMDSIQIMNAIRKHSFSDYATRIPEATKANLRDTVEALWDGKNFGARNEFIDALVNQIGLIIARNNSWNNPLAIFKRGMLTFGNTIEEVHVGLAQGYAYDTSRDYLEKMVFGQHRPEVQASIHKVNREMVYPITINENMLKRAFFDDAGLQGFVSSLMASPSNSDNVDEFNIMCNLLSEYERVNGFYNVKVPNLTLANVTRDDAEFMLREVRAMGDTLAFPSRHYNASGMHSFIDSSKAVFITTPRAKAAMDVKALAGAFNLPYAEIDNRIIVIPEENLDMPGTQAILTTEDFFVIADTLLENRSIQNPAGLYNNYFLHHHGVISASRFVPAVRFSTDDGTVINLAAPNISNVSAIEVSVLDPITGEVVTDETELERGKTYQVFAHAVNDIDNIFEDVRLELDGANSNYTVLTNTGMLHIGNDDDATGVTVKATSLYDETKSATGAYNLAGDILVLWPNPRVIEETETPVDPEP